MRTLTDFTAFRDAAARYDKYLNRLIAIRKMISRTGRADKEVRAAVGEALSKLHVASEDCESHFKKRHLK